METKALFDNIAESIQQEIRKAEQTIFIAVAWFTNKSLFSELLNKAKNGCSVNLIVSNDDINKNSNIEFESLNIGTSKVYFIGDGQKDLMHNKFCVIDTKTVITGSYNWSYKAEKNHENIVITSGDQALTEQFIKQFKNIRKRYFPDEQSNLSDFPIDKIIRILEIIKNYIILEDIAELSSVANKLKEYTFNGDINNILHFLQLGQYSEAVPLIEKFLANKQQVLVWIDPEIFALKLEVKSLENQVVSFDNEKTELEGILRDFQREHFLALGDLLSKLLQLRKLKYKKDKEKFEEAEKDEQEYQEQYAQEKEKEVFDLTDEEKKEVTSIYRKAAMLCHPDKFSQESPEVQAKAEEMMKELTLAKEKNDLERIKEIFHDLKQGKLTLTKSEESSDKIELKKLVKTLREKLVKLEEEIIKIKESEEYQTIQEISDWNEYFQRIKEQIDNEIETLRNEINISALSDNDDNREDENEDDDLPF